MQNKISKLNPHVSVDCVIFGFDFDHLNVLLIERELGQHDHALNFPRHALPGNLIGMEEDLNQSAKRVLVELTGLENIYLEQYAVFGQPGRTRESKDQVWLKSVRELPQERVVTVAYYSLINQRAYQPTPASFASKAEWYPINNLPALAFDHEDLVKNALKALRISIRIKPIGYELLPKKFTLRQLQRLYESILSSPLDKRNFRRKIVAKDFIMPLDEWQKDVRHKPAQYYSFDFEIYHKYRENHFDFNF